MCLLAMWRGGQSWLLASKTLPISFETVPRTHQEGQTAWQWVPASPCLQLSSTGMINKPHHIQHFHKSVFRLNPDPQACEANPLLRVVSPRPFGTHPALTLALAPAAVIRSCSLPVSNSSLERQLRHYLLLSDLLHHRFGSQFPYWKVGMPRSILFYYLFLIMESGRVSGTHL